MESTLVRVFLNKSVIVSQLAVSVCSIIFGYLPVASSKFCWKLYNMVSSFLKIFGIIVCMDFFLMAFPCSYVDFLYLFYLV